MAVVPGGAAINGGRSRFLDDMRGEAGLPEAGDELGGVIPFVRAKRQAPSVRRQASGGGSIRANGDASSHDAAIGLWPTAKAQCCAPFGRTVGLGQVALNNHAVPLRRVPRTNGATRPSISAVVGKTVPRTVFRPASTHEA